MDKNQISGRLVIIGIVSLFILGSTGPMICAELSHSPSVAHRIHHYYPVTIQVQVSRWTEDDELETTNETWTIQQYNDFQGSLGGIDPCGGGGSQDAYLTVFQQYGIIPEGKTMTDLENFLAAKYAENQEIIEQHMQQQGSQGRGYIFSGSGVFMRGTVERPIANFHIPAILYYLVSDFGGSLEYSTLFGDCESGSFSGDDSFDGTWYIWIGAVVPPLVQFLTPYDISFTGFALVAHIGIF